MNIHNKQVYTCAKFKIIELETADLSIRIEEHYVTITQNQSDIILVRSEAIHALTAIINGVKEINNDKD